MFRKPVSFRRQLFTIFSAGASVLAVAVSFLFAWLSSTDIRNVYIAEGLQATSNFARDSELALLYDSGDNAVAAAEAALAFPSIREVYLFNHNQVELLHKGKLAPLPPLDISQASQDAVTVREDSNAWFHAIKVYSHAVSEDLQGEEVAPGTDNQPEYLGYVIVVQNKDAFKRIQFDIFTKNVMIGLSYSLALILLLHLSLKQLLRPMDSLSNAMSHTRSGNTAKIAELTGPAEIQQIAHVYNDMVDAITERDLRLRLHNEQLEALVKQRTRELVIALDDALDASKQKSMFLASVSHELRTPLQSIIGYSDLLRESLLEEGMDHLSGDITRITDNAEQLLGLINSILDLAKAEAGKTTLHLSETNLEQVAQQAQTAVLPLLNKNQNVLNLEVESDTSRLVIDEIKLRQILINLLGNAAKFTSHGQVNLRIHQTPESLRIEVQDTGIGIDTEAQSKIFTPFVQADGSLHRRFEGTGLGLSICKLFCELMGGQISVVSTPGKGATFTVVIPLPIRITETSHADGHQGHFEDTAQPPLMIKP